MKIKSILFTSLAAAVIGLAGCKKDIFDINTNPNSITSGSVTPSVILPSALQNTSRIVDVDWPWTQMWMGFWARSGSYQSLTDIETYKFTNDFPFATAGPAGSQNVVGNPWTDLFSNANNYHIMITRAQASGAGFYEAIGRIMKAHNFGILVDLYNNVPYTQAFQGTGIPTPAYDKGSDIYKDLFKQLDTAVALLKNTSAIEEAKNPDIKNADLVYKGSATNWIKFANTLRLRLLIHLHPNLTAAATPIAGFDVAAQAAKITSEGFIESGESAHLNPGFSATKPSPYYRAYVASEEGTQRGDIYRGSEYAIEYYKYNGDPRIDRFYVAPAGGHKGIPFGRPSDATGNFTGDKLSTVRGPGLIPDGAASRAWILTSVESLFLQAEARERGILTTGETADSLLTAAVRESFIWLGLSGAAGNTYVSNNAGYADVDYAQSVTEFGSGLFAILSQKWFALNTLAPFEIYTDWRRTDIVYGNPQGSTGYDPGPAISVDPGAGTKIPVRLFYPQNEYNYNATNVATQGTINVFTSRIFWDVK